MTAQQRTQAQQAAGRLLAQADEYERQAAREIDEAAAHRLRGRALQQRGSAWVLQAELMEASR